MWPNYGRDYSGFGGGFSPQHGYAMSSPTPTAVAAVSAGVGPCLIADEQFSNYLMRSSATHVEAYRVFLTQILRLGGLDVVPPNQQRRLLIDILASRDRLAPSHHAIELVASQLLERQQVLLLTNPGVIAGIIEDIRSDTRSESHGQAHVQSYAKHKSLKQSNSQTETTTTVTTTEEEDLVHGSNAMQKDQYDVNDRERQAYATEKLRECQSQGFSKTEARIFRDEILSGLKDKDVSQYWSRKHEESMRDKPSSAATWIRWLLDCWWYACCCGV